MSFSSPARRTVLIGMGEVRGGEAQTRMAFLVGLGARARTLREGSMENRRGARSGKTKPGRGHGVRSGETGMKGIHLEVTYEDGRPWVAYLYLPRKKNEMRDHCVEVEPDMVLDINEEGKLIGIELLAPQLVTLEAINAVLAEYGLAPLDEAALKPIVAA